MTSARRVIGPNDWLAKLGTIERVAENWILAALRSVSEIRKYHTSIYCPMDVTIGTLVLTSYFDLHKYIESTSNRVEKTREREVKEPQPEILRGRRSRDIFPDVNGGVVVPVPKINRLIGLWPLSISYRCPYSVRNALPVLVRNNEYCRMSSCSECSFCYSSH